jgi:hypothetical protein
MAAGPATRVTDIVVPEIFTPYVQQLTEQKARIIQSGLAVRDPAIDILLAGGGLTFNVPSFRDLDDDADRVSNDTSSAFDTADASVNASDLGISPSRPPNPNKIQTSTEVAVRLSRNNSWSSMDLAASLAGKDPMEAIADRVAYYWTRRLQAAFVATWNGVIADNVANDSGDYVNNIASTSFVDGVTNFSAEAFLDASVTMGDSMEDLTAVMVHSVVYNRMQKNNLIDFIPDSNGRINIPTFLGREVIVDDGVPRTGNVYDTWLFGGSATRIGVGQAKVPTEVERRPGGGNGGGQEVLYNRVEWTIHPVGHAMVMSSVPNGGPANTALDDATTWNRVYPERKQIKFARLVTREA